MDKHNLFSTDMFHYHKDSKEFTQEASTLKIPAGYVLPYIVLRNPKTKGVRKFELLRSILSDSGEDVGGWEYTTSDQLKLTVWND